MIEKTFPGGPVCTVYITCYVVCDYKNDVRWKGGTIRQDNQEGIDRK